MGPFDIYAIIDGHRGEVVAEFIRDHLMDVILRNENIMIYRYFSIGLKQVFLKLDEILSTPPAQEKLKRLINNPETRAGTCFLPKAHK